jgi:type IV secretory pathway TrbL component
MADRSAAAKKAAQTLKVKRAGQKAAVTRKRRAAAKKAVETRRANKAKLGGLKPNPRRYRQKRISDAEPDISSSPSKGLQPNRRRYRKTRIADAKPEGALGA